MKLREMNSGAVGPVTDNNEALTLLHVLACGEQEVAMGKVASLSEVSLRLKNALRINVADRPARNVRR